MINVGNVAHRSIRPKRVQHPLRVVFRIYLDAHAIFQINNVQAIAAQDNCVGSAKATIDPIAIVNTFFDHYQISINRQGANVVGINTHETRHFLIFKVI